MIESLLFPKIDLDNVDGVIIDIDSTLYPYMPAHTKALQICCDFVEKDLNGIFSAHQFAKEYMDARNDVIDKLAPQGACRSRLFAFQSVFENKQIKQAYVKALQYENLYWESLISNMQRCEEAADFFKLCYTRKIAVCALTDMQSHFQIQKLQALQLEKFIDYMVSSEEVGIEKPDKQMFQTALRKLDKSPEQVIMIGDSQEKDIDGAQNIGIKSYKVMIKHD